MERQDQDEPWNNGIRHSQTPSINSQSYAIPVTEDMITQLSISPSSNSSSDDSDTSGDISNTSVGNSSMIGGHIPVTNGDNSRDDTESASFTSEMLQSANDLLQNNMNNENDILRQTTTRNTSNYLDPQDQSPNNMIDVSKYIFDSLKQAIESADFSESLSCQTKTSARINTKSLELKQLIDQTQSKMLYLQERFERGVLVSKNIRHNLNHTKKSIDRINNVLRTDYPIEFNQARDKIMERSLSDEEDNEL